jgi:electron transfer flavoprotein alpha subunit
MAGNIWILTEHWRGRVSDVTYEALALGREIAEKLGVRLEATLLGSQAKDLAHTLGAADTVLYADHPALEEPLPQVYAEVLALMAADERPRAVLIPLTNVTLGIGALLAAKLRAPGINFCRDVRVSDGQLEAECLLYGGKVETVAATEGEPAVFGILPGVRPAEKGRIERPAEVRDVAVAPVGETRVRLLRYIEPEAGDVDITQQDVLVSIGRGIQSQDNLSLAEELAGTLGGVVCGSRPVIDQGWLPLSRQVGKSGMVVKPKLYVALGVSGAPEHQEGMKNAELIIAVNTDPSAPIFNIAHYGVTADLLDVVPHLIEEVRQAKAKT